MNMLRAWLAQWFAKRDARICLRCLWWTRLAPGIEPVGRCSPQEAIRYAHETCAGFQVEAKP